MSIGTRIKEARRDKKLTQKQLADKVGVKQPTLSELENGDSAGTTMVASFAAALGVNALWLETGKGEKHSPQELKRVIAVDENDKSFIQIRKVIINYFHNHLPRYLVEIVNKKVNFLYNGNN